ncbi:MarR family transcriptional regulator [Streptomyces violarus]|uniref:DNA-binding MarR family transcriptional regulator n=1 Tax=Streptomyces violarus TaxID=67380 RepID=A0A7W4ZKG6_9ACTN|nr:MULTISPECIES: MarR family transcriptional regulator [Streptomyces]MBB3074135.1 DNA-binding MarR family transcriptional regulator [Streptomyces violarus]WRT96860.1 MarR family transcriptional regulator [Streptomyces sp. CGMCC 4.1772]GHC97922.1 MarR family transcriptional regulator [Streptomyces violarus]
MAHTPAPPAARSAAQDSDPDHDALMERLARAAAGYYRDLTAAAALHGLTMTQAKMLILLRQPLPMRALAGRLACDASNITGLVDRLEARGLVSRHADAADRRIKNVVATAEGREAVRLIRADMRGTSEAFARLDEEGRRGLYELLGRLHPEDTQETT